MPLPQDINPKASILKPWTRVKLKKAGTVQVIEVKVWVALFGSPISDILETFEMKISLSRVWLPGRKSKVLFEMKYWLAFWAYSERVKQGFPGHSVSGVGFT